MILYLLQIVEFKLIDFSIGPSRAIRVRLIRPVEKLFPQELFRVFREMRRKGFSVNSLQNIFLLKMSSNPKIKQKIIKIIEL